MIRIVITDHAESLAKVKMENRQSYQTKLSEVNRCKETATVSTNTEILCRNVPRKRPDVNETEKKTDEVMDGSAKNEATVTMTETDADDVDTTNRTAAATADIRSSREM